MTKERIAELAKQALEDYEAAREPIETEILVGGLIGDSYDDYSLVDAKWDVENGFYREFCIGAQKVLSDFAISIPESINELLMGIESVGH